MKLITEMLLLSKLTGIQSVSINQGDIGSIAAL